jgi:hypothetical protein
MLIYEKGKCRTDSLTLFNITVKKQKPLTVKVRGSHEKNGKIAFGQ